ncbi:MAG: coenzyme F420-0:L-glutamate ligase [Patescibacteria group bacterium]|nr:coenzyme F420-0:L-glutamate ligase [Patescibacteria group bacterium]
MKISALKTNKIDSNRHPDLFSILNRYLRTLKERSVLVITSKIVSICEGRVIKIGTTDKIELIHQEAEYYLPPDNIYNISLTIKNNLLAPTAGIDESNGNGYYILWPKNPQKTANCVRSYLQNRFNLHQVGVVITDSKTTPLRWGTTGIALAHSGFAALKDYIGNKDIFGRKLKVTKANIMDALASAAVVVTGEGNEQTPLAIIEDVPFVKFQNRNPTNKELKDLKIALKDDLYGPLLTSVPWKKGKIP